MFLGSGSYNFKTNDFSTFLYFTSFVSKSLYFSENVKSSIPHVDINLLSPFPICK